MPLILDQAKIETESEITDPAGLSENGGFMDKGFMTEEELKAFIVKELPRLIAEHPELRYEILGVVSESFVKKDDFKAVLDEIRQLREDLNRRFGEFTQIIARLREDFNKQFDQHSRETWELRKSLDTIGSRWGIFVEDTFRNSMKMLLDRYFGARVEEIIVGGYQVDLLITNGFHMLVEITSSTKEKDIENLLKAANAYRQEKGIEPHLYIVTAYISPRLYDFAKEKGISILSHDAL